MSNMMAIAQGNGPITVDVSQCIDDEKLKNTIMGMAMFGYKSSITFDNISTKQVQYLADNIAVLQRLSTDKLDLVGESSMGRSFMMKLLEWSHENSDNPFLTCGKIKEINYFFGKGGQPFKFR